MRKHFSCRAVAGASVAMLALLLLCPPAGAQGRPAPTGERQLSVVNSSARPVNEIYVSPAAADTWGTDRLEESTLAPGATVRLSLGRTAECRFDVQIVYDDATHEDHPAVDVCRMRTLTVDGKQALPLPGVPSRARQVVLANQSRLPIRQVFISPAYSESWGEDLLAQQILQGDSAQISYRGDCAADLRVVFANRAAEERRGLDLCATQAITIAPGWTTTEAVTPTAQSDAGSAAGGPAAISR